MLSSFELNRKTDDAMIIIHCFSFMIFNVFLIVLLWLKESKDNLKEREKKRELTIHEELDFQWKELTFSVVYLLGTF